MKNFIAIAMIVLSAQASAAETKVITGDFGGNIRLYGKRIDRMSANGDRVEIRGFCISACTMYTGMKNVCVERGVSFKFHGPILGPFPTTGALYRNGVREMARYMHPKISEWYLDQYLQNSNGSYEFYTLKSTDLIEGNILKECL